MAAKPAHGYALADVSQLPPDARWREYMGRVEAAIFASPEPLAREVLARLVGPECRLDDLIADIRQELRSRPYDLVPVANGWHHRTRPRFSDAVRACLAPSRADVEKPKLTASENLAIAAIAYLQPVTRVGVSQVIGREISRDVVGALRRQGLITAGPRSPEPGAPLTYVTTEHFLAVFGLNNLRDLPDIEALQDAGLLVPDATNVLPVIVDEDTEF